MISPKLCIRCKGRLFCGAKKCYILEKYSTSRKVSSLIDGKRFEGSSPPSVFVSWRKYPKVDLAPLAPPIIMNDADLLDNPERWFGLSDYKILSFREQLIRSNRKFEVSDASNPDYKLVEIQEMVMSQKPVEAKVKLKNKPKPILSFDQSFAPVGPVAEMENFELTSNPSVARKIDYLVSDVNVKSIDALKELYSAKIPVHSLHKLLSVGVLGVKKDRRLTPTRWAITAVDSNLSKEMIDEKIKYFQEINEIKIFNSNYLDNNFFIILFPSKWCFEQLEAWQPGTPWSPDAEDTYVIADYEFYKGRKDYASNVTGAYYAARLAVAEYLVMEKRQAGCLIFREIGGKYSIPLGVWQIRENVRNALKKKPLTFSDLNLSLKYVEKKLSIPLKYWLKESKIFDRLKHQRKISDFF